VVGFILFYPAHLFTLVRKKFGDRRGIVVEGRLHGWVCKFSKLRAGLLIHTRRCAEGYSIVDGSDAPNQACAFQDGYAKWLRNYAKEFAHTIILIVSIISEAVLSYANSVRGAAGLQGVRSGRRNGLTMVRQRAVSWSGEGE